jgi:hypothetical protein
VTVQPSPNDRATSFQAVEGNPVEQYNGATLMVVAYVAVWVILFVWIGLVWRKQRALDTRLSDLEREIDKAAAGSDKKS